MKKTMQMARWGLGMIFIFFGGYLQGQDLKDLASAGWDSTVIDSNTKKIIFNDETGEVTGCDLLEYIGEKKWREDSLNQIITDKKIKTIIDKIQPEDKAKIGTVIIGGDLSPNGDILVFGIGSDDGISHVWFVDDTGKIIDHYRFDYPEIAYSTFNAEGSYFMLSNTINGNFYFFDSKGKLVNKGNFNQITLDSGTSYGKSNISEDGSIWVLINNQTFIFDKYSRLISKTLSAWNTLIDAHDNLIVLALWDRLAVYDYYNNKLLYLSERMKQPFMIEDKKIKLLNHSKTGRYEYILK